MTDTIERIADELDLIAESVQAMSPATKERKLRNIATRLRALSPAGGGGRGCDWYEDEDTGSRIVDFDFASDHSRQLSLILKANGEVAYAAYINGTHMNGADAMTPEFYSAIRMLSASPQKSPTVGDWMMVPARLTGPMAYAMVERLGHPDSSPQDCWTATLAASPQQEPGAGELCKTCGGHGVVCYHTGQTPEQYEEHTEDCPECTPSGQTLAGAGGDGECPLCSAPVKIWRDHRDGRGNEYEYVAPRSTQVMAAGAPTAQKPLDESANNAGVATGSRNDSPSESVIRGSLPPLTTATSAGTTGDDSEDAARYRWLREGERRGITITVGHFIMPPGKLLDEAIDDARRAREVGK